VLATLYAACAEPPKRPNKGAAGAGPVSGSGGDTVGEAGANNAAGSGGTGDATPAEAGMGGEGGAPESAGAGGEAGASEPAAGGATGGDPCPMPPEGISKLPVPVTTTSVPKPSGAQGGLKVVNWAGFKGALSYTFDDNLQTQITNYNTLNAVGVPVTFYLVCSTDNANPIWKTAVKDGHELGNHTMHHCGNPPTATNACAWGNFTTADAEIDDCTAQIKAAFGVTPYTFAGPYGDPGWATPASSRFLVGRGVLDPNGGASPSSTDAFNLPCHISTDGETADSLNLITDNVRAKGTWRTILVHSFDKTVDGGYNPVKISEMVKTMTYTKGLGDVWADTVLNIGAYWRAQAAVTNAQVKTVGADKVYSWTLPDHFPPGHYLRVTVAGGKVKQCGSELAWDDRGYYEINLDAGSLTISP